MVLAVQEKRFLWTKVNKNPKIKNVSQIPRKVSFDYRKKCSDENKQYPLTFIDPALFTTLKF